MVTCSNGIGLDHRGAVVLMEASQSDELREYPAQSFRLTILLVTFLGYLTVQQVV